MITDLNIARSLRAAGNHYPVANHMWLTLAILPIDLVVFYNGFGREHRYSPMLNIESIDNLQRIKE